MICVSAIDHNYLKKAEKLSNKLRLPLKTSEDEINNHPLTLVVTPERLELRKNKTKSSLPIYVDFLSTKLNYRIKHGGGKNQLIARAIGIKGGDKPSIIDATAGFGVDAFVLASLGCKVTMFERSPIIYTLLEDGLIRLKNTPLSQSINLELMYGNAITELGKLFDQPDVIYLDPMFPKRKKQILNKKTMRILHDIVGNDNDAPILLETALKYAKNRTVIKRPKYTRPLTRLKPDLQFSLGGSSRYDVYLVKNS